jgi:hypothetical protein
VLDFDRPETSTLVLAQLVVNFEFSELDTVVPAFGTTVHKNHGSQYPAVAAQFDRRSFAQAEALVGVCASSISSHWAPKPPDSSAGERGVLC